MVEEKQTTPKINKTNLIFVVGAILGSLLAIIFIGKPLLAAEQSLAKENKAQKAYIKNLETKLQTLISLKDRKSELAEKNEKVLAAIPNFNDVGRLFMQFEKVAQANGLVVKRAYQEGSGGSTTTSKSVAGDNGFVSEVSYTTSTTAKDYPKLKETLSKLQSALRMLSISNVTVKESGSSLDATITVKTYVRR